MNFLILFLNINFTEVVQTPYNPFTPHMSDPLVLDTDKDGFISTLSLADSNNDGIINTQDSIYSKMMLKTADNICTNIYFYLLKPLHVSNQIQHKEVNDGTKTKVA